MAFSSVKVMSTSQMVVAAYDLGLDTIKIAYCRHEDQVWKPLDCGGGIYYDVVCCDQKNTLFQFALAAGPSVDSWDFNDTIPTKTTIIPQGSCPSALATAHHRFSIDLYDSHAFLGSTPLGQIFLIVKYVEETLGTVGFLGFRLDRDRKEWINLESCNFPALFLGLNQSVLVPAFEDEVVFYSNDYWESFDGVSYGVVDHGPREMIKEEAEEASCS